MERRKLRSNAVFMVLLNVMLGRALSGSIVSNSSLHPTNIIRSPLNSTLHSANVTTRSLLSNSTLCSANVTTSSPISNSTLHSANVTSRSPLSNSTLHSANVTTKSQLSNSTLHSANVTTRSPLSNSTLHSANVTTRSPLSNSTLHSANVTTRSSLSNSTLHSANVTTRSPLSNSTLHSANVTTRSPFSNSTLHSAHVTIRSPLSNSTLHSANVATSSPPQTKTFFLSEILWDTNAGDIMSYDFEMDQRLTFTCRNRCGFFTDFPCSCDPYCVLYDTCCENIDLDCPHIWEEGRAIFDTYDGLPFVCGAENVFKINSAGCMDGSQATGSVSLPGGSLSGGDIEQYVQAAPVTDSDTGFTYLNKAVLDCYKNKSTTTNSYLSWGIRLLEDTSSPHSDNFVSLQSLSSDSIAYEPIFKTDILYSHLCAEEVIDSCGDFVLVNTKNEYDYFSKMCQEFTAMVYSDITKKRYRNRYCAYCREGRHDSLSLKGFFQPSAKSTGHFSILVSLSADGEYELVKGRSLHIGRDGWSTQKCPNLKAVLSINKELEEDKTEIQREGSSNLGGAIPSGCEALQCKNSHFTVRPDKICRADYHMTVAFKDNELGLPSLSCPTAARQIGDFVSCSLDLSLRPPSWESVENLRTLNVSRYRATTDRTLLYFLDIHFTSKVDSMCRDWLTLVCADVYSNLHVAANIVKAYQIYRTSHSICAHQNDQVRTDDYAIFKLKDKLLKNQGWYGRKSVVEVRGEIVDDVNRTVFCFSRVGQKDETLDVDCFEDPNYMNDQQEINNILNSPCIRHLKADNSQLTWSNDISQLVPNFHSNILFIVLSMSSGDLWW